MVYIENGYEKLGINVEVLEQLEFAMRYKSKNIKARMQPIVFERVAEELGKYRRMLVGTNEINKCIKCQKGTTYDVEV